MFKKTVLTLLTRQAKRYLDKHQIKVIAVTGSVGKTSTKLAIAEVLSQRYIVRSQRGNYNVDISVPLVIFDVPLPRHLHNPFSWLALLSRTEVMIHSKKNPVDVIVLELGTDQPGDVPSFGRYLTPDIAVVTAVAAEHMESFKTIDAVAKEELSVARYSKLTLVNRDDVSEDFAADADTTSIDTYGLGGTAEYRFVIEDAQAGKGFQGKFISPELPPITAHLQVVGEHNVKAIVAAGAVAIKLGMTSEQIAAGFAAVTPVSGRMQLLRGLNGATLIDDTYNSSPASAIAALQTLYTFLAPQRIALLGNMNELGDMAPQAHEQVGLACDGRLLEWVVTIGDLSEKYLAPAAASKGCQVRSFRNAYDAGAFVHKVMHPGSVILVKGSQNGIFAEEAVKVLLHDSDDEAKLVRQTPEWLRRKGDFLTTFK